jgi:hypothetical protein
MNSYGYVNANSLINIDNYGLTKIRGRFAGINIQNVDVTNAEFTENPYFGDSGVGDGDAMTMGWVSWQANVDAGLRIICAEFDEDCNGNEFIKRSWYPISGMSLYGLSGNFAVVYSPLTAIRGLLGPKALAYSIAAARAAKEANKKIKESLEGKYGSLNAFATAVCMATASLPER